MTALSPASEDGIAARVRGNAAERAQAFRDLFDGLKQPVFALCLQLCRDRAEAEDALQDTFLAVHRGLADFRGQARLSTWVYRIAVRSALAARARRRSGAAPLDEAKEAASPAPLPDEEAASRELAARARTALARLSAEHQVVLSLFALDGLSHKEIAAVLGVAEGTVWARLHQARKALLAATKDR